MMLAAAALLGWAAALGIAAPSLLRRGAWTARAPRLGVLLWQAASVSFVATLVLGGLTLAVPATVLSGGLADLFAQCVMAVRDAYRTPAGAGAAGSGLVLAAAVTARTVGCLTIELRRATRRRRAHAHALALVAHRDESLGALVVDHAALRAYCLPGRGATIVLTSATIAALRPAELAAVLAHERAHVRARHHLAVAAATALRRAFPRVPLLRAAADIIPVLVEMAADDTAARRNGRARVAAALAALAAPPSPARLPIASVSAAAPSGALAAAGPSALRRVQRLLRPAAPLGRAGTSAALLVAVTLLGAPAAAALAPGWAAEPEADCRMLLSKGPA